MVTQQAMSNTVDLAQPMAMGATPAGEGVDLHFQSIGKRTLALGNALSVSVARGQASYQRIVEWIIPDTRNEHGQHAGHRRDGEDGSQDDVPWDALRFAMRAVGLIMTPDSRPNARA